MKQATLAVLVAVTTVAVAQGQSQIVGWGRNNWRQCSAPALPAGLTHRSVASAARRDPLRHVRPIEATGIKAPGEAGEHAF